MTEWQPIETAPKDGTRILLAVLDSYATTEVEIGFWLQRKTKKAKSGWRSELYFFDLGLTATHWMPLPEPPK